MLCSQLTAAATANYTDTPTTAQLLWLLAFNIVRGMQSCYSNTDYRLHENPFKSNSIIKSPELTKQLITLHKSFNAHWVKWHITIETKGTRQKGRVPTLLLTKNPGLSRTAMDNIPGPVWSPRMSKYKEKTTFTYNIQSAVHCRKFNMKQNVFK